MITFLWFIFPFKLESSISVLRLDGIDCIKLPCSFFIPFPWTFDRNIISFAHDVPNVMKILWICMQVFISKRWFTLISGSWIGINIEPNGAKWSMKSLNIQHDNQYKTVRIQIYRFKKKRNTCRQNNPTVTVSGFYLLYISCGC